MMEEYKSREQEEYCCIGLQRETGKGESRFSKQQEGSLGAGFAKVE